MRLDRKPEVWSLYPPTGCDPPKLVRHGPLGVECEQVLDRAVAERDVEALVFVRQRSSVSGDGLDIGPPSRFGLQIEEHDLHVVARDPPALTPELGRAADIQDTNRAVREALDQICEGVEAAASQAVRKRRGIATSR